MTRIWYTKTQNALPSFCAEHSKPPVHVLEILQNQTQICHSLLFISFITNTY